MLAKLLCFLFGHFWLPAISQELQGPILNRYSVSILYCPRCMMGKTLNGIFDNGRRIDT